MTALDCDVACHTSDNLPRGGINDNCPALHVSGNVVRHYCEQNSCHIKATKHYEKTKILFASKYFTTNKTLGMSLIIFFLLVNILSIKVS